MSDEVEEMFSARGVPWHGKGTVVTEAQTAKEAIVLAGLDWEVELWPMRAHSDDANYRTIDVPNRFATVRKVMQNTIGDAFDADERYDLLGDVGGRYQVRQNKELFGIADAIVGSGADAPNYHTAGSLAGGKRVFMTLGFPQGVTVGGIAPVDLYLVLAGSHDGSMANTAMITPVVVVCQNTLNLATLRAQGKWTFPHDGSAVTAALARQQLDLGFEYVEEWEGEMEKLMSQDCTKADFEQLVRTVFPGKTAGSFTPEQYALIGVLEASPNIHEEVRYTAWGALNAVREYDDWGRSFRGEDDDDRADARLDALWFGRNVKRADETFQYLKV